MQPVETKRIFSETPWEEQVGYCRAVKRGNHIFIAGTTAVDKHGNVFEPGHAYAQTKRCLEIINDALIRLNASLTDVVRTRMFVTDMERAADYGRAHREVFSGFPPATSLIGVKALILPDILIEIEADAVLSGNPQI